MSAATAEPAAGRVLIPGTARAEVLACHDGLSFWGGVDPATGRIIDIHHPCHGRSVAGRILLMPTSRGSCSGSGVLVELALAGLAPAALVFCEAEEILTLGALVADRVFGHPIPLLSLPRAAFDRLAGAAHARLAPDRLSAEGFEIPLEAAAIEAVALSARDRARLSGAEGPAVRLAMEIICRMAAAAGAGGLIDVRRGHIDGCILAHSANLRFAEEMARRGARVVIPTTINAISVDRENWRRQGVAADFGSRASRLADAYVAMGARPVFTCAPYLLDDPLGRGEAIGWSESNAVIYANSVLGARTAKHPDYLDLFIAMTGRAPATGIHSEAGRAAAAVIELADLPEGADDLLWPLLGWLAGRLAPDRIPLLTGLKALRPSGDDLKALCAAFGTTSGAPMLHVAGHTPEAARPPAPGARRHRVGRADLAAAWRALNGGGTAIDLVAIGSPHASLDELRRIEALLAGRRPAGGTEVIVTLGRDSLRKATAEGLAARLADAGVRLLPDLCWCSMTEPVFPARTRTLMTNSGKYAHYAPALTGRQARLASLADCIRAAVSGTAPAGPPAWLGG